MIGLLCATSVEIDGAVATFVCGGVGYLVQWCSPNPPQSTNAFVRMKVREDDISLFGFQSIEDRRVFDELCAVEGVGPRLAALVMRQMTLDELRDAASRNDAASFTRARGVGAKTAERMMAMLRES